MNLPLTTTRVRVERGASGVDPYDDPQTTVVGEVNAVVSIAFGSGREIGGDRQVLNAQLHADPDIVIHHADQITDLTTGEVWTVDWVRRRYELGIEYTKAGLTQVSGASDA